MTNLRKFNIKITNYNFSYPSKHLITSDVFNAPAFRCCYLINKLINKAFEKKLVDHHHSASESRTTLTTTIFTVYFVRTRVCKPSAMIRYFDKQLVSSGPRVLIKTFKYSKYMPVMKDNFLKVKSFRTIKTLLYWKSRCKRFFYWIVIDNLLKVMVTPNLTTSCCLVWLVKQSTASILL